MPAENETFASCNNFRRPAEWPDGYLVDEGECRAELPTFDPKMLIGALPLTGLTVGCWPRVAPSWWCAHWTMRPPSAKAAA
jgi:hypothetical protein